MFVPSCINNKHIIKAIAKAFSFLLFNLKQNANIIISANKKCNPYIVASVNPYLKPACSTKLNNNTEVTAKIFLFFKFLIIIYINIAKIIIINKAITILTSGTNLMHNKSLLLNKYVWSKNINGAINK